MRPTIDSTACFGMEMPEEGRTSTSSYSASMGTDSATSKSPRSAAKRLCGWLQTTIVRLRREHWYRARLGSRWCRKCYCGRCQGRVFGESVPHFLSPVRTQISYREAHNVRTYGNESTRVENQQGMGMNSRCTSGISDHQRWSIIDDHAVDG